MSEMAESLPLRECGLKQRIKTSLRRACPVTPLAGVWIETSTQAIIKADKLVTPLAGVWIETQQADTSYQLLHVTPLAGVWIET